MAQRLRTAMVRIVLHIVHILLHIVHIVVHIVHILVHIVSGIYSTTLIYLSNTEGHIQFYL